MPVVLALLGALVAHFLVTRLPYWLARTIRDTPLKTFVLYAVYAPLVLGLSWRFWPEQPLWPQSAALCLLVLLDFFVLHPYRAPVAAEPTAFPGDPRLPDDFDETGGPPRDTHRNQA